ncbi:hypothetical protein GCM10010191_00250 [Actinomadura vinacea]|uniref:Uncharacterized protein n=1 Tax=Actinomadura vinacea TaxID=115336 RepID=A0ABN3I9N6_9ACTN
MTTDPLLEDVPKTSTSRLVRTVKGCGTGPRSYRDRSPLMSRRHSPRVILSWGPLWSVESRTATNPWPFATSTQPLWFSASQRADLRNVNGSIRTFLSWESRAWAGEGRVVPESVQYKPQARSLVALSSR